jgi:plasmid stabilization system protein ParE
LTIRIRILASARRDLEEGIEFYERQQAGLGDYFIACLKSDIERLRLSAGVHRKVHGPLHRALSRTFPYALYYRKDDDQVLVFAIVDCRRDPAWIQEHLSKSEHQE